MVNNISRPNFGFYSEDGNDGATQRAASNSKVSYVVPDNKREFISRKSGKASFGSGVKTLLTRKNRGAGIANPTGSSNYRYSNNAISIAPATRTIPVSVDRTREISKSRTRTLSRESVVAKPLNKFFAFISIALVILSFFGASFFTTMSTDISIKKAEVTESLDSCRHINQAKELEIEQKTANLESKAKSYGMINADKTFTMSLKNQKIYGM